MTAPTAPDFTEHGEVPVDSGHLLIVDPCHLPVDLLARLTRPSAHGVTLAVVVQTPQGDGWYPVLGNPGELSILDPNYIDDEALDDPRVDTWGEADTEDLVEVWSR